MCFTQSSKESYGPMQKRQQIVNSALLKGQTRSGTKRPRGEGKPTTTTTANAVIGATEQMSLKVSPFSVHFCTFGQRKLLPSMEIQSPIQQQLKSIRLTWCISMRAGADTKTAARVHHSSGTLSPHGHSRTSPMDWSHDTCRRACWYALCHG